MRLAIAAAALLTAVSAMPAAAQSCARVEEALTPAIRSAEADRVSRALKGARVYPENVTRVMKWGTHRLVWATPENMERGVFVFRGSNNGYQFVDSWGGVVAPGEEGDAAAWLRAKPGSPSALLSRCFAEAVAGE